MGNNKRIRMGKPELGRIIDRCSRRMGEGLQENWVRGDNEKGLNYLRA